MDEVDFKVTAPDSKTEEKEFVNQEKATQCGYQLGGATRAVRVFPMMPLSLLLLCTCLVFLFSVLRLVPFNVLCVELSHPIKMVPEIELILQQRHSI
ncbi:hypothetical protein AVEN_129886-1 [Araneus ventricosus]|uniref:Uncharacterized protein n=1 Tax=Araneus ventricosus TaxID=182803 RepID=A0A4Y2MQ78_ARAVE|nr:hypothetical protein AVEN_129886-1 [Araneus ventricosus]